MDSTLPSPRIEVTAHGPYRVVGTVAVTRADGSRVVYEGSVYLCRCGGSRNKPICDATHGLKNFDGAETADHRTIAERRTAYPAVGVTVFDDRSRCAHFGQCTSRLPAVFRAGVEPFVEAGAEPAAAVINVVAGCPSGALAYSDRSDGPPIEVPERPSITPIVDGPYRVRGTVPVIGADGRAYEVRERQTLCRCGQSRNKPFCDGSHWYARFRDPQPADEVVAPPTLFDWAGGMEAFERLTARFYEDILGIPDPILEPIFRNMDPEHPKHVAAWLAEVFGGPAAYTAKHGGYEKMAGKHRNLALSEQQRQRWIGRLAATADIVGWPTDPDFRAAFVSYLEWGTRIAVYNSQPGVAIIEHAPVPHWGWGQTPPYTPQPWDPPDAAQRGRDRYRASGTLDD